MITIIIADFCLCIINILLGENRRKQGKDYRMEYFIAGIFFVGGLSAGFKIF
jgi:hypothetical protein